MALPDEGAEVAKCGSMHVQGSPIQRKCTTKKMWYPHTRLPSEEIVGTAVGIHGATPSKKSSDLAKCGCAHTQGCPFKESVKIMEH